MLKKSFCLLFGLLLADSLAAQDKPTLVLTPEKAMQMAVECQAAYQNNKLAKELALHQLKQAWYRFYPQASLSYDFRANLIRQTNILPGEIANRPDDIKIQFGTLWSNTLALDFNQYIFDKTVRQDLHLLELNQEIADVQQSVGLDNFKLSAVKAYYAVLINRERLRQQDETIARLQDEQREANARLKAELINTIELERIENAIRNAQIEKEKIRQNIELSEKTLRYHTGIPAEQPLELSEKLLLSDVKTDDNPLLLGKTADVSAFPEYKLQQLQVQSNALQLDKQKAAIWPTLSGYGYLAAQSFTNNLGNLPWYGFSYIGLKASWKINTLFENKEILPQVQIRMDQANNSLRQLSVDLEYAVSQAKGNLLNALRDVQTQQNTVAMNEKEVSFARSRFNAGLATTQDITEAEKNLAFAQINQLIAWYNYISAQYEFKKAIGQL